MATSTADSAPQAKPADPLGFGAYGAAANPEMDLRRALDKPPESKIKGSLDFTDSDKRWLKDLGITTTDPFSYHEVWRTEGQKYDHEHRKWNESMGGRLAMRSVSRGIVGAVFYAAANMYTTDRALKGYSRESVAKGPLQHVARFIDNTVGRGIEGAVKAYTHNEVTARRAVSFRDTRPYGGAGGRSLGAEAVAITFDFASMSFGDYMTRYAIGLMDPNAKKHWMKDGHLDIPGGLKDLLQNVVRGVTYAAGEDMAVAIPYVYGMRLQRHIINKYSPGFKLDSDMGLNGGSVKVRKSIVNGIAVEKIAGDYQLEGMLDLVGRFSWYNVGTKMFRDAYSHTLAAAAEWWKGDRKLHAPHVDLSPAHLATVAAHGVRYVLRTTVKVMGYMLPASFVFAAIRTPQTRIRGAAIDPERGVLGRDVDGKFKYIKPGTIRAEDGPALRDGTKKAYFRDAKGVKHEASFFPFGADGMTDTFTNAFYRENIPFYNVVSNPVAKFNYRAGSTVSEVLAKGANRLKSAGIAPKSLAPENVGKFARIYANAALAYTPYFMLKTDVLSSEWDTARTDMGLDRSLDGLGRTLTGVVTLSGQKIKAGMGEFRMGLGEAMRSLLREPFTDPRREEKAQRERWSADPEHASNEAFQLNGVSKRVRRTDDVMTGKPLFAHDGLKAKPITPATFTALKTPDSWAAQEALRKFQEASASPPQGQSLH